MDIIVRVVAHRGRKHAVRDGVDGHLGSSSGCSATNERPAVRLDHVVRSSRYFDITGWQQTQGIDHPWEYMNHGKLLTTVQRLRTYFDQVRDIPKPIKLPEHHPNEMTSLQRSQSTPSRRTGQLASEQPPLTVHLRTLLESC